MILLSCRNWQKKEETGRVTFSCLADFAASRPSRYSGVLFAGRYRPRELRDCVFISGTVEKRGSNVTDTRTFRGHISLFVFHVTTLLLFRRMFSMCECCRLCHQLCEHSKFYRPGYSVLCHCQNISRSVDACGDSRSCHCDSNKLINAISFNVENCRFNGTYVMIGQRSLEESTCALELW
jgi:hypothetical protein